MRLVVVGANGRMGRELLSAITHMEGVELSAAIVRQNSALIGQDVNTLIGGMPTKINFTDNALEAISKADGILDFSLPEASVVYAGCAAQARIVHIIGTTGFSPAEDAHIEAAARHATIVKSGNMSLGVNMLAGLVKKAAQALVPQDFDIEIVEMHHRRKVDAPSGTALLLGEAAAEGREIDLNTHSIRGRNGHTGAREQGTIGFASLRGGTVIGDHSVIFAGENETITLSHHAQDRSIFARGAIKAALWAKGRKHGLYTMQDVLGLND